VRGAILAEVMAAPPPKRRSPGDAAVRRWTPLSSAYPLESGWLDPRDQLPGRRRHVLVQPHRKDASARPPAGADLLARRGNVVDVGCGRGLLRIGAALWLSSGTAVGVDIWNWVDLSGNRAPGQQQIQFVGNHPCGRGATRAQRAGAQLDALAAEDFV